jgi:protein SCO1/2
MKLIYPICIALVISSVWACQPTQTESLPILGRRTVSLQGDTLYHTIGDFSFVNQDSVEVTPRTFDDKVYVADFFFTSCPTICPTMKTQMLRIYEEYQNNPQVAILSHSIDPTHDTVAVLRDYAQRLGVENSDFWHFVTGDKDEIFTIGQSDYMVTADEDAAAPGGFIHSGAFLLVDKQKRIRGVYDGTMADDVDQLMDDINTLLQEASIESNP